MGGVCLFLGHLFLECLSIMKVFYTQTNHGYICWIQREYNTKRLYSTNEWSTPAEWKHYNKMAVLHFFRVNYTLCIIYYLWVNAIFQKLSLKFRVTLQLTTVPSKLSFLAMFIKYSYFSIWRLIIAKCGP